MSQLSLHSPLGDLTISEEDGAIVSLDWGRTPQSVETDLLCRAKNLLDDYFDGRPVEFNLPLVLHGTDFQKKVWEEMRNIHYGKVMTYGEMAKKINSHARAVGGACGANPIPIIVPCHRVMGQNGILTGFSGGDGVETKKYLLDLEAGQYSL